MVRLIGALGVLARLYRALLSAYATLPTVAPGQVISSSDWGNKVKGDIEYLLTPNISTQTPYYIGAADPTNTTVTFTDTDGTNHKLTITPQGTRVLAEFGFFGQAAGADAEWDIRCTQLAARGGDATHGSAWLSINQVGWVTCRALFTGLTPNTQYDFTLQQRTLTAGQTAKTTNTTRPLWRFAKEA